MTSRRHRRAQHGRNRHGQRGQAAVELAVVCIVLVPLILYTLFLFDLLRYKLDQQEAVAAAPWDATVLDYQQSGDVQPLASMNRRQQCDESSAYDSFDESYDCAEAHHHRDLAAHSTWLLGHDSGGERAEQVRCGVNHSVGMSGFSGNLPNLVNKGGKVYCTGRLGVVNKFLPQQLLMSFSQVEATRAEQVPNGSSVHAFAAGQSSSGAFLFARYRYSLLADSWALTTTENVSPNGGNGPLYQRVRAEWQANRANKARQVGRDLIDDKILSPSIVQDLHTPALGDDPTTVQVGFTNDLPPELNGAFASPWDDGENNPVSQTASMRGTSYLGASAPP